MFNLGLKWSKIDKGRSGGAVCFYYQGYFGFLHTECVFKFEVVFTFRSSLFLKLLVDSRICQATLHNQFWVRKYLIQKFWFPKKSRVDKILGLIRLWLSEFLVAKIRTDKLGLSWAKLRSATHYICKFGLQQLYYCAKVMWIKSSWSNRVWIKLMRSR